jgi:hypothetical protein
MIKATVFALLFIVIGSVAFSLLAPLLFRGTDFHKLGTAMFPLIVIGCGAFGGIFGWLRGKK